MAFVTFKVCTLLAWDECTREMREREQTNVNATLHDDQITYNKRPHYKPYGIALFFSRKSSLTGKAGSRISSSHHYRAKRLVYRKSYAAPTTKYTAAVAREEGGIRDDGRMG